MRNFKRVLILTLIAVILFSFTACNSAEENDKADTKITEDTVNALETVEDNNAPIMSSDRVMSKYFDISLFDEENYADIYLGKKFKIESTYAGDEFQVPTTISKMNEIGWKLKSGNAYDENSLVFSYETIETVLENEEGLNVKAWFYNSSRSSKKLNECNIVKFLITNNFYADGAVHHDFNINGISNSLAISDIVNILGTPSHFYEVSENLYYLDYFITKKDRRNGITVYVNPVEDSITSIEFSYYK